MENGEILIDTLVHPQEKVVFLEEYHYLQSRGAEGWIKDGQAGWTSSVIVHTQQDVSPIQKGKS